MYKRQRGDLLFPGGDFRPLPLLLPSLAMPPNRDLLLLIPEVEAPPEAAEQPSAERGDAAVPRRVGPPFPLPLLLPPAPQAVAFARRPLKLLAAVLALMPERAERADLADRTEP